MIDTETQAATIAASLDEFTTAYLECALWTETDELTPQGGEPLDKSYGFGDFHPDALQKAITDCAKFQSDNADDLALADYGHPENTDAEMSGHDFWLTRNGHGTGFWDRDIGLVGDDLTKAAEASGECNAYVGDDGMIHLNWANRRRDTMINNQHVAPIVPVMLRVWRSGSVTSFALFPTLPSDRYGHYCDAYAHIGQHSGANYWFCIQASRPATAAEGAPLVRELERIGYQLRVIQRTTMPMHEERRAEARRIGIETASGNGQPAALHLLE